MKKKRCRSTRKHRSTLREETQKRSLPFFWRRPEHACPALVLSARFSPESAYKRETDVAQSFTHEEAKDA